MSTLRSIRGLRWWMMGLLMLGAIINYLTRSTLSFTAPTFMKELDISTVEYSLILNAFQATIMLQPLCGFVMDTLGLKLAMILFASTWSVVTIAHGWATNWVAFAGLRGLLGLAEGSANPAGMKATAEWFPAKERGFAGGMYNIGASVGSMLAPVVVGFAIAHYNWQMAFVITGAIGLVWVLAWWKFYHPKDSHPALSAEEADYIAAGQEAHLAAEAGKPSVRTLIHRPNFWGIALPRFLADPTWSTLTFWLPLYLSQVRGFNLKELAMTAWLPFLAADLGCMAGGVIVAFLQRRGVGLINARRGAFTIGAILMTGVAFVGYVDSPFAAVGLLCLGGFAHQTLSVTVITMASDLFKRSEVATVAGMAGTCGNAGILVFNLVIGVLLERVGYTPFFISLAVLDLVGAAVLWMVVRDPAAKAA
jgi:ACS family hexuronate transporter-like MFS transporter